MKKGLEKKLKLVFLSFILLFVLSIIVLNITGNVSNDSLEDDEIELEEEECPESPTCSGTYLTGYDEDNCPIYKCPSCIEGETKKYTCPDGEKVDWCHCSSSLWVCVNSPENACSYSIPETEAITASGGGGGTGSCPVECICNENTIVCNYPQEATEETEVEEEACPSGCLCGNDQVVCEQNVTSKGECAIGCEFENTCVLPGIRTTVDNQKQYCDIDSEWKVQKSTDGDCDNNFECKSNLCISERCISQGFLDKIFSWFRNLFEGE